MDGPLWPLRQRQELHPARHLRPAADRRSHSAAPAQPCLCAAEPVDLPAPHRPRECRLRSHHPRHIDETLDLFALTPLAGRLPRDLSGGELQRVSLARAFAVPNATLMLLDEPFTGIDRLMRERLISVLAACNVPILSVTHDVEEALLLDAEVLRLESGRIIATGPASEVLAPELVRMRELLKP
jgi:molybdate transport system ATP-binding protein